MTQLDNAATQRFGHVGVLMGGDSSEREVSLRSGHAIVEALGSLGVSATGVDLRRGGLPNLSEFDRVFIALHGSWGEDGTLQGMLEMMEVPYTGSGVLASALAMDKVRSKLIWQSLGLPTAPFCSLRTGTSLEAVAQELGFPLFVKPIFEGSSVGVSKADNLDELVVAVETARGIASDIMVEAYLPGEELTVAVLNNRALPPVLMRTPHAFYDYAAKYASDQTTYLCPAPIPELTAERAQQIALEAFNALGCEGWGRVDLKLDAQAQPVLLEVNTVPGMTKTSLVPMAAAAEQLTFAGLCAEILNSTLMAEEQTNG